MSDLRRKASPEEIHLMEVLVDFGSKVAALLGSLRTWDRPDDLLEDIGEMARGLPYPIGDDDDKALAFWRAMADDLGVDYDKDEEWAPWQGF